MDKKLLQEIKNQLLKTRESLLKSFKKPFAEFPVKEVGDSIDNAFDSIEKETTFEATDNARNSLNEIDIALQKIEQGKFGVCEKCKKYISDARLKVLPTSRLCIKCQEKAEHKK
jgi:DnaK suppressor protein